MSVQGNAKKSFKIAQPLLPDGDEYKILSGAQKKIYQAHHGLFLTLKDIERGNYVPDRIKQGIKDALGSDAFDNPEKYLKDQNKFRQHLQFKK